MILTGRITLRRTRFTRRELLDVLTATQRARDTAIARHRRVIDTASTLLEQTAAGYDQDADHLERPGVKQHGKLTADQRRAIADELRNCARDLQARCR